MDELIKDYAQVCDLTILINKGLYSNNAYNDNYYKLYKNYRKLLDKYLLTKLSLDKYDKKIDASNLKFIPVGENDMDYYQYISTMNLKYIYLRNNIYVEKLSKEQIDILLNLSADMLENPTEELYNLIEETYIDVIDKNTDKDIVGLSRYGPDNDYYWLPSNEIVIGIRHDDFADNGLGNDDAWQENENNQNVFLNSLIDELKAEASKILGINVNVIWYDDFTIEETVNIKKNMG